MPRRYPGARCHPDHQREELTMTDHVDLFAPGAHVTYTATADVIGGRLVEITGPRSVLVVVEAARRSPTLHL